MGTRRNASVAVAGLVATLVAASPLVAQPTQDDGEPNASSLEAVCTFSARHVARLGPEVSGRVQRVRVEVGDRVRAGQPLVELDPALYEAQLAQARAAEAVAAAALAGAKRDFERIEALWRTHEGAAPAVSEQRRDAARTRFEVARAQLAEARTAVRSAELRRQRTVIRAPFDGVVTARWVAPGDVVNSAPVTRLLEVSTVDPIVAEFSLPQRWLAALRAAADADPPVRVQLTVPGAPPVSVPIERIRPQLDEATRSVRVRLLVPNAHGRYRAGMLGTARLRLRAATP